MKIFGIATLTDEVIDYSFAYELFMISFVIWRLLIENAQLHILETY